ncbi:MAG TPA: DUF4142 domain-containing protein [Longimicrobiales bacterium]
MRLVLIVLLAAAVAGCNRGDNKAPPPQATKPAAKPQQRAVYPEEDVVAILRALDTAEIVTSRVAREVSQNDQVLSYAGVMIKDHGDIMQLVAQTGITPRDNAISGKIRRDADSIARGLSGIPMGFNNTYIEEQAKSHRAALQTFDSVIVPSAKTPELRSLLEKLRPALVAHLQRAMQILAIRRKETAERGEQWVSGLATLADTTQPRAPVTRPAGEPPVSPAQTQPRTEPRAAEPKPAQPRPRVVIPPAVPDTTPLTTTTEM